MLSPLTSFVKRGLLTTEWYRFALRRRSLPGVAVLSYHGLHGGKRTANCLDQLHVSQDEFERHCWLLRRYFNPISLEQWRTALRGGPSLPRNATLVTFDDGYQSVATLALPVLQAYSIPFVVFVCSEPVEKRKLFWFDVCARAYDAERVERVKRLPFDASIAWQRQHEWAASDNDIDAPMTPQEVRLLSDLGAEIGAHTADHVILSNCTPEQQRAQIASNKFQLEQWTGKPVRAIAYPNGQPNVDYGRETVEIAAELGFDFGFCTRYSFALAGESPLEHSRMMILTGTRAFELAHRLCYSWPR